MTRTGKGRFVFRSSPTGIRVFYRGRCLGELITSREPNGRYCYRLAFDRRRKPQTYRGRLIAAEALFLVDSLKQKAKKEGWTIADLIIRAWELKPHRSPTQVRRGAEE